MGSDSTSSVDLSGWLSRGQWCLVLTESNFAAGTDLSSLLRDPTIQLVICWQVVNVNMERPESKGPKWKCQPYQMQQLSA